MNWKVYLAGEIHSDWRDELFSAAVSAELPIEFLGPITDHAASDDCGVNALGEEPNPFWHDRKGAGVNALRRHPCCVSTAGSLAALFFPCRTHASS